MIEELRIQGFRSIASEVVTLDNPTFVVGANGSGKSNFVDVFAFLAEAMDQPLEAVFRRRGGISAVRYRKPGQGRPYDLGIQVSLGLAEGREGRATYSFLVGAAGGHGFVVKEECCLVPGPLGGPAWFRRLDSAFTSSAPDLRPRLEPAALLLPRIGGDPAFAPLYNALAGMRVYSIESAKLREMQDPDSGLRLSSDGSNAASVLTEIRDHHSADMEGVSRTLATIVPNTTAVRPKTHGNKVALEFEQDWGTKHPARFDSFSMSDGTLRVVGLLAAVYQPDRPTVLVIEEPEATIHPGAIGSIMDLVRHAASRTQVIVTTHSPDLLDAQWIEDRHLRVASWERGVTRVTPVGEVTRRALQAHLMGAGELMRSNALYEPDDLERGGPAPVFDAVGADG
jgi:predicted ATPase